MVVDKIQERTTEGKDIEGSSFTPYSKEYARSKGVTRNSVDLVLTGNMLTSFQEAQRQRNVVKIKLRDEESPKAYNHNVGDTLPKRTFFGVIEDSEIDDIVSKVKGIESPGEGVASNLAQLRAAVNTVTISVNREDEDGDF